MRKDLLKGLSYFMSGVFVATGVSVSAQQIEKSINVQYRNIKIYADGNLVNTSNDNEAFIYNGTTYLPVRAVGEAFNKAVDWDGSTSSVYVGTKPFVSTKPTVLLEDLDYFTRTLSFGDLKEGGKDNTGIVHSSGIKCGRGEIEYLLNGRYSRFAGTVGLDFSDRNTSSESTVKIYGDNKLIYTSPILTGGVQPSDFNVDVTGVLNLKIEVIGGYYDVNIYDAGLYL